MTEIPPDLKYIDSHEWIKIEGEKAIIGITDYAQTKLTDIVYVEFGDSGREVAKGDELGTIESVKTVSEIYAPLSGTVEEYNNELEESPQLMNEDPYGKGWFAVIKVTDPSEVEQLLDSGAYSKLAEE
ncbi:MAG: glycine cleavage system protein GcvH [Methanobacteriota archaeon]|nr:MAG: glycine cleavage system protein GcvH [Euryarchaeota archaeon]